MTDTKEQLQAERAQLAERSKDLMAQSLTLPEIGDDNYLDNLNRQAYAQLGRQVSTINDQIYVIDQRLQLIQITEEYLANLQAATPVE
jgi:hypothetical protein